MTIENPNYYIDEINGNKVECQDHIQATSTMVEYLATVRNTIKAYAWRLGRKGDIKDDLIKIKRWCDFGIDYINKNEVSDKCVDVQAPSISFGDEDHGEVKIMYGNKTEVKE